MPQIFQAPGSKCKPTGTSAQLDTLPDFEPSATMLHIFISVTSFTDKTHLILNWGQK